MDSGEFSLIEVFTARDPGNNRAAGRLPEEAGADANLRRNGTFKRLMGE